MTHEFVDQFLALVVLEDARVEDAGRARREQGEFEGALAHVLEQFGFRLLFVLSAQKRRSGEIFDKKK